LQQFGYKTAEDYPQSVGEPRVYTDILVGSEAKVLEKSKENLKMILEEYYKATPEDIKEIMENMGKSIEELEKIYRQVRRK